MLKQISCDKFISNGVIREPVVFHKGLNSVIGGFSGDNSIGKSTFLLILDFVFGGKDYIDFSKQYIGQIIENVGHHAIKFEFVFENNSYYFIRTTEERNIVRKCDENYNINGTMSLDEYCKWLREKYKTNLYKLTFRNVTSKFIRIDSRGTVDTNKPLKEYNNDSGKKSIDNILVLFDKFEAIEESKNLYDDAKGRKDAYKKATTYALIPIAKNKTQIKVNKEKINKLQQELNNLLEQNKTGLLELNSMKREQLKKLTESLAGLKFERANYQRQIDAVNLNCNLNKTKFQKDYKTLKQFFPNINIDLLDSIENFHNRLSSILKDEIEDTKTELNSTVELLNIDIEKIEDKIKKIVQIPNLQENILYDYSAKSAEIERLKQANDSFEKINEFENKEKEFHKKYKELENESLIEIQKNINYEMEQYNTVVTSNRQTNPPTIKFNLETANSYEFFAYNDIGSGTSYKNLILFDLACLKLTCLPFVVHDNVLFKQIEDAVVSNIVKLYSQNEKQIFIAIDKENELDDEAKEILHNSEVLRLSFGGNELFGKSWRAKKENPQDNQTVP